MSTDSKLARRAFGEIIVRCHLDVWSLALIGNASGRTGGKGGAVQRHGQSQCRRRACALGASRLGSFEAHRVRAYPVTCQNGGQSSLPPASNSGSCSSSSSDAEVPPASSGVNGSQESRFSVTHTTSATPNNAGFAIRGSVRRASGFVRVGNPPTEIETPWASAKGSNGRYTATWRAVPSPSAGRLPRNILHPV